jgi:hypothetical protein
MFLFSNKLDLNQETRFTKIMTLGIMTLYIMSLGITTLGI